jgi:hypothetical protein
MKKPTIKKQTRNEDTSKGIYTKVRSRFVKGKDGQKAVITLAREKMIEANGGKDPGPSMVAHHVEGSKAGANNKSDDDKFMMVSFGDNVSESNQRRGGKDTKEWIRKRARKGG